MDHHIGNMISYLEPGLVKPIPYQIANTELGCLYNLVVLSRMRFANE